MIFVDFACQFSFLLLDYHHVMWRKVNLTLYSFDRVHEKLCASNLGVDKKPTTFHWIPTAHIHTMPRSHLSRHREPRSSKPGCLEQYKTNINNNLHQQNNHHLLMDRLELIMLD